MQFIQKATFLAVILFVGFQTFGLFFHVCVWISQLLNIYPINQLVRGLRNIHNIWIYRPYLLYTVRQNKPKGKNRDSDLEALSFAVQLHYPGGSRGVWFGSRAHAYRIHTSESRAWTPRSGIGWYAINNGYYITSERLQ